MTSMVFSGREVKDIALSVTALALVFSYPEIIHQPEFFAVAVLTVGVAFIGHELAHKFVARQRGFWAEYRMWPQGIMLTVLLALATGGAVVFAAPGAVYFAARGLFRGTEKKDVGLIGIAGIAFNLVLFAGLAPLSILTGLPVLRYAAMINIWLALFNLIPVPPLDGTKVFAWNKTVWLVALLSAGGGFAALMFL